MAAPDAETLARWMDPAHRCRALEPGEAEAMVAAARIASLLVVKTPTDETPGAPGCWLGGEPTLPPGSDWPMVRHWQRDAAGDEMAYPMHFFAQFDLGAVPRREGMPDLPDRGTLFFFADYLDHVEPAPRPHQAVIFCPDDCSRHPPRSQPAFPEGLDDGFSMVWWRDNPVTLFRRWPVTFHEYDAIDYDKFPNDAYYGHAFSLAVMEEDRVLKAAYKAKRTASGPWGAAPLPGRGRKADYTPHRLFGNERTGRDGQCDPQVVRLFTLSYDHEDLNFHYNGQISFFISAEDLKARAFDRAWAFTEGS